MDHSSCAPSRTAWLRLKYAASQDDPAAVAIALKDESVQSARERGWSLASLLCDAIESRSLLAIDAILRASRRRDLQWIEPKNALADPVMHSPLGLAILRGHAELAARIARLGEAGPMMHQPWTPLGYAAFHNQRAVIEALLGVLPAAAEPLALSQAIPEANVECFELLLSARDPRGRGIAGRTALMEAARQGRTDLIELLLPLSDLEATDHQGRGALDIAREFDRHEAASAIEKALLGLDCAKAPERAPRRV